MHGPSWVIGPDAQGDASQARAHHFSIFIILQIISHRTNAILRLMNGMSSTGSAAASPFVNESDKSLASECS